MRLQSYRNIKREDFDPQYQGLIDRLSFTINSSFESLFNTLNGQSSLTDNILCEVDTFTVTVDSSGKPLTSTQFTTKLVNGTKGSTVIAATSTGSTPVYPTGTPFVSFSKAANTLTVTNIAGLPAGTQFNITVIIWGA